MPPAGACSSQLSVPELLQACLKPFTSLFDDVHVLFASMSAPHLDVSPGLKLFFCVELACTFSADVVWLLLIVLNAEHTATAGAALQSLPPP